MWSIACNTIADLEALQPPFPTGLPVPVMQSLSPGQVQPNFYFFVAESSLPSDGFDVIRPTAVAENAPGRFIRSGRGTAASMLGADIPRLNLPNLFDRNQRIQAEVIESAPAITIDANQSSIFIVDPILHNLEIPLPINAQLGDRLSLSFHQPGIPFQISWEQTNHFRFVASKPQLTQAVDAWDEFILFTPDGTNWLVSAALGYGIIG